MPQKNGILFSALRRGPEGIAAPTGNRPGRVLRPHHDRGSPGGLPRLVDQIFRVGPLPHTMWIATASGTSPRPFVHVLYTQHVSFSGPRRSLAGAPTDVDSDRWQRGCTSWPDSSLLDRPSSIMAPLPFQNGSGSSLSCHVCSLTYGGRRGIDSRVTWLCIVALRGVAVGIWNLEGFLCSRCLNAITSGLVLISAAAAASAKHRIRERSTHMYVIQA